MILGHQVILSAYGFWLPNDPRGSWSDFVAAWELFRFGGKAIKVDARCSVAHRPHDRGARLTAKRHLQRPPVSWDGPQAVAIVRGFQEVMERWSLRIHACSIMPEHVHLVIGRNSRNIRQVMNQLQGRASQSLVAAGMHPFQEARDSHVERPTCWVGKGWDVFLDSAADIHRAIRYVEENPVKEGKRRQKWSMVVPYRG